MVEQENALVGKQVVLVLNDAQHFRLWGKLLSVDAAFVTIQFDDARIKSVPVSTIDHMESDKRVRA